MYRISIDSVVCVFLNTVHDEPKHIAEMNNKRKYY